MECRERKSSHEPKPNLRLVSDVLWKDEPTDARTPHDPNPSRRESTPGDAASTMAYFRGLPGNGGPVWYLHIGLVVY
jgi:hypothetical protein